MAKTMRGAEDPTPAEQAAADEAADKAAVEQEAEVAAAEEEEEDAGYIVVEFVGEPPYGREFLTSHTIQKSSADPKHKTEKLSFAGQGIEVPQDLVWHKDSNWVVKIPVEETELIEALRTQPFLKVRD